MKRPTTFLRLASTASTQRQEPEVVAASLLDSITGKSMAEKSSVFLLTASIAVAYYSHRRLFSYQRKFISSMESSLRLSRIMDLMPGLVYLWSLLCLVQWWKGRCCCLFRRETICKFYSYPEPLHCNPIRNQAIYSISIYPFPFQNWTQKNRTIIWTVIWLE